MQKTYTPPFRQLLSIEKGPTDSFDIGDEIDQFRNDFFAVVVYAAVLHIQEIGRNDPASFFAQSFEIMADPAANILRQLADSGIHPELFQCSPGRCQ